MVKTFDDNCHFQTNWSALQLYMVKISFLIIAILSFTLFCKNKISQYFFFKSTIFLVCVRVRRMLIFFYFVKNLCEILSIVSNFFFSFSNIVCVRFDKLLFLAVMLKCFNIHSSFYQYFNVKINFKQWPTMLDVKLSMNYIH